MGILKGKKALILGVASNKSIAWGIAKILAENGALVAFTYQGEALRKRVEPLAKSIDSELIIPCDVSKNGDISKCFQKVSQKWDSLDFIIHSIAYSNKNELAGKYIDTSLENFLNTLVVSCYSLTEIAREG